MFFSLRCTTTVFTMSSFDFSEADYVHSVLLFIGDTWSSDTACLPGGTRHFQ